MGFTKVGKDVYLLREPFGGTTTDIILLCGEHNFLIDAGGSAALVDSLIVPALQELTLSVSDIDYLLCTHTHGDHIGGFCRMRELGVKKIAAYSLSVPKIENPVRYNIEIRKAFPKNSPPPSENLVGTSVDLVLNDGDVIDGRVELIATPGHDDDAVCLYDRQTKTLVCGDSVQLNGTTVQGCGAYMYLNAYRASVKKLSKITAETALLGHMFLPYGDVVCGRDCISKLFCDALEYTYIYRDFVREQYENGERDLAVIAENLIERINGVMPKYLFLPLYTVREHMKEVL